MRRLLIRPQARLYLLEIWHYVAADSIEAADRLVGALEASIRKLLPMPGMGHVRRDVRNPALRFWSEKSYVIANWYDDTSLTVIRIVHGRRDFRGLFRGG